MLLRATAITAAFVAVATPAMASTQIAALGRAPLVGQIASTTQLRADFDTFDERFTAAAKKMGLTPAEFREARKQFAFGSPAYVTIPRHLDYMSSAEAGHVSVLHDVTIPADQHGWEVDIRESDRTLAIFVPNACGNLSLLVRPATKLAVAPAPKPDVLAERLRRAPDAPALVAYNAPPAQIASLPNVDAIPPAAAPSALPPEVVHHTGFLAPVLGAIGAVVLGSTLGGGSHGGGAVTGIACP